MADRTPSIYSARNAPPPRRNCLRQAVIALVTASALASAHPAAAEGAVDRDAAWLQAEYHTAPIVNGHRIQPTPGNLPRPDISERSARVVEELYRQLMTLSGRWA